MGIRELLILLLIFAIVVVVLRGLFVAISSRKNKIKIALDKNIPEYDLEELELRELPSGGARQVERSFARVMQSQGMNEPGSAKSGTGVGIPARKSTLKPPRTNVFKNRDQNRAATAAAGTVAAATAATSTMAAQAAAAEQSRSGEQTPVASSTDSHQTSAADTDVQTPSAESVETVQADHSQAQEMAPEPETLASTEGIDLVETEVEEVTVKSEEAAEDSDSFEPVTTDTDIDNDDPLGESMNDDSWDNGAEVDDAWMDDVSPAREVNRTAAATAQSESSVLSESVSDQELADQELEEAEAEEEDSAEDFHEEGFDLDRAEPLFANNRDDDDWEDSDAIESETDEDAWEDASTDELDDEFDDEDWNPEAFVEAPDEESETDAEDAEPDVTESITKEPIAKESHAKDSSDELAKSGRQWQAESHDDDDALFSEAAADDLDSSDWDIDDEEDRPELDDWDDEEEDNNVFLSDVSEPGEVMEEREPTEDEIADIATEESAKEGMEASDNDADWDDFEDDQSEPVLGEYVEEEDSVQPAVSDYDEDGTSVEAEEDADLEAVNFDQDDAETDPLIDEGDPDSGSLDVDLVAEEYAQDEAPHPEREDRDLDHVLDELLEENAAPMTVSADDADLDDESASAEIDSAETDSVESEEERETEEMTQDGKKTSDSLEYSANEDVDNEVLFEDRDDEDFNPLFDYSEKDEDGGFDDEPVADDESYSLDAEDAVDSAVDQEDHLISEEDELLEAEYSDREDDTGISDTADATELAEEAETAEADEEDSVPDFDDELEADAEPEPSEDDAFAAVDPEDDLDELFDDEDRLRRQAAMEEIEEKESRGRNWMSWASGAFKRLGAKKSADTFEPVESSPEQVHQQQGHRQPDQQQPQYDQDVMQGSAATQWQQEPVESNADQDQWYEQTEENAQTEYDERYPEHQDQETVWNDADDQQGLGYPEDAYPQESAGSYQEQQLSLDIEMDAQAAEAAAGQQGDGYGRQRRAAPGQAPRQSASQYQQQSAFDDGFGQGAYTDNGYDEEGDDDSNEPSEVLAINVLARQGRRFAGDELLQVLLSSGLRFGEMSIFHRHANGKNGPVLFSVANALNPGTFDLNEISEFTTPGVCFFMTLPNVASNNMLVYEQMLATARHVQQSLDAELKDDNRSVMTAQTMEHYRQRIRDFELQQLKHAHGRR